MNKLFCSLVVCGLVVSGYSTTSSAQSNLGTNQKLLDVKSDGGVDISRIQDEIKSLPQVSDSDASSLGRLTKDALDAVEIPEGMALPENVKEVVELTDVRMEKPKVPEALNHKQLETQRGEIDLEKIASQYNKALVESKKNPQDTLSDFDVGRAYLFISSTLPKTTLERLLNDAGKYGVAVFLKGNIGADPLKFEGTQEFMQKLKIDTPPELFIHPDAFQMFKIDRVPALVVAASNARDNLDQQGCAAPADYDIIRGDLKLSYNLMQIYEKTSSPDIKDVARKYVESMKAEAFKQ